MGGFDKEILHDAVFLFVSHECTAKQLVSQKIGKVRRKKICSAWVKRGISTRFKSIG
jgi:hypothetical protein